MSPLITLIKVGLSITGRWAVGAPADGQSEIDQPILVNPTGASPAPHLPGTSLAGALREHLGPESAAAWLEQPPGGFEQRTGTRTLGASRLWILGALPSAPAGVHDRGVTAVDPARAAASGGTLRTVQWAPAAAVSVLMQHDGAADAGLLDQLATWRPVLGRGRTAGMGQAKVTDVLAVTIDLHDPAQLTWWMRERDAWFTGDGTPPPDADQYRRSGADGAQHSDQVLDIAWRVREPLHVGVREAEKDETSTVARTFTIDGHPAIPGSSWKGVYRHRAESILMACCPEPARVQTVVTALFGSADAGRGRLTFSDTTFVDGGLITRTHVAIDRFTGGARDGALYRVEAVREGAATTLRVGHAPGPIGPAVSNLLGHVSRDLHDGLIGIGGHARRGYGWVELTEPARLDQLFPVDVDKIMTELTP